MSDIMGGIREVRPEPSEVEQVSASTFLGDLASRLRLVASVHIDEGDIDRLFEIARSADERA